jgi:hypothetical protein
MTNEIAISNDQLGFGIWSLIGHWDLAIGILRNCRFSSDFLTPATPTFKIAPRQDLTKWEAIRGVRMVSRDLADLSCPECLNFLRLWTM